MENTKLNIIEASFVVVIITITHLILNLPNDIIQNIGSSAIINTIYISVLALIMFLIVKMLLSPFDNNDILYVAEYIGGSFFKKFLSSMYIICFIFIAGILLRSFADTLQIIYYPKASLWTILLLYLITSVYVNKIGIKNVIKANAIIIIPVLIAIIVTAFSLLEKFDFNKMFPLMGYGINQTFVKGTSNIYAFSGLVFIYFIKKDLKDSKNFTKVGIISIVISSLYLLLTVSALLMTFPFLSYGKEALSVYLSTRVIEYGKFMQRTDALYMFVWIFTFLSYLSIILVYINKIGKESFYISDNSSYIYIVSLVIFIIALLPKNTATVRFIEVTIYKYLSIGITFFISLIVLLLGFFKKRKEKTEK